MDWNKDLYDRCAHLQRISATLRIARSGPAEEAEGLNLVPLWCLLCTMVQTVILPYDEGHADAKSIPTLA
jgi:hypothetical protein